mgnify:FL=1
MKRISIIIASALAAMLSASCSKSIETPAAPSPGESIILDLSIAGFDGAGDTKAVKTGWAAGDKLNLWFDDWNYTAQANNPIPDLVITYDGSKWTAGALAAGRSLKPSGKFSVVYEGYNDLTKYNSKFLNGGQQYQASYAVVNGARAYQCNIVYFKTSLDYTYADNKLTATISDWETYTGVKILVKGLNPAEAANYGLRAEYFEGGTGNTLLNMSGFSIDPTYASYTYYPTVRRVSGNNGGCVLGVPDADGVAFYYVGANFTSATVEFRLFKKNATSGNFDEAAKAPKFTGKTLETDGKSIKGIVIDKSKFE